MLLWQNPSCSFSYLDRFSGIDLNKIFSFKFHVHPDPKEEETVVQLIGGANYQFEEMNYKFENAALIDCIKGYFNPKAIDINYLTQTYEYMQKNILNIFREKGD